MTSPSQSYTLHALIVGQAGAYGVVETHCRITYIVFCKKRKVWLNGKFWLFNQLLVIEHRYFSVLA